MECSRTSRAAQGFTLIEVLLAIFIFAIVISSVYGAYRATFTVIHNSEGRMATSRSAQVAIERIGDDLRSLVVGPGGALTGENRETSGVRGDRLTFVSASHLALSRKDTQAGFALIGYRAEPDEQTGLLNLYRLDRVLLPGPDAQKSDTAGEILATGLTEVSFSYVDADGRQTDEWDSEKEAERAGAEGQPAEAQFPVLIYVKLVFASSPESGAAARKDDTGGTVFRTAVALPEKPKKKA